jgi:hypothetical protein
VRCAGVAMLAIATCMPLARAVRAQRQFQKGRGPGAGQNTR